MTPDILTTITVLHNEERDLRALSILEQTRAVRTRLAVIPGEIATLWAQRRCQRCGATYVPEQPRKARGGLTMEKARAIRAVWAKDPTSETKQRLADEYEASLSAVDKVISGKTWKEKTK